MSKNNEPIFSVLNEKDPCAEAGQCDPELGRNWPQYYSSLEECLNDGSICCCCCYNP